MVEKSVGSAVRSGAPTMLLRDVSAIFRMA